MTLLYATGWDLCASFTDAALDGWASSGGGGGGVVDIQTASGRNSGAALRVERGNGSGNNPIGGQRTVGTISNQCFIGFAMQASTGTANTILSLLDSGTTQIDLRLATDGSLTLTRNGTTLGTAPAATVTYNTYHYYEISAIIASGTGGSVTVKRDMTTVISVSGVNTQASGNASWNQIQFGGGTSQSVLSNFLYDDFYLCDNSGSYNNNFLGDLSVRGLLPNAAGTTSGLTQTGGSGGGNFTAVNEKPNDGDTSYVSSNLINTEDTYKYPSLPVNTISVFGVVAKPIARKDDAGNRHITTRFRHTDGTEGNFTGSDITLTTSYTMASQPQDTNPRTGIQWTSTDLTGEFGPIVVV